MTRRGAKSEAESQIHTPTASDFEVDTWPSVELNLKVIDSVDVVAERIPGHPDIAIYAIGKGSSAQIQFCIHHSSSKEMHFGHQDSQLVSIPYLDRNLELVLDSDVKMQIARIMWNILLIILLLLSCAKYLGPQFLSCRYSFIERTIYETPVFHLNRVKLCISKVNLPLPSHVDSLIATFSSPS